LKTHIIYMSVRKVQRKFTQTIKALNEGKVKYDPIDEKPIDFRSYTDAQINEIKDYINLTRELVNEVERKIGDAINARDVGRPSKSKFDIAKAIPESDNTTYRNRLVSFCIYLDGF